MRKEIWRVLKDLENEKVTTNEAHHLLCDLFAVSERSELLKEEIFIPKIENYEPGKNTILATGQFDEANGVFVEWLGTGRIVFRIDGKDYKQTFQEFINNCNKTK